MVDRVTTNQVVDLFESDDNTQGKLQYEQVKTEPLTETNNDKTAPAEKNPTFLNRSLNIYF